MTPLCVCVLAVRDAAVADDGSQISLCVCSLKFDCVVDEGKARAHWDGRVLKLEVPVLKFGEKPPPKTKIVRPIAECFCGLGRMVATDTQRVWLVAVDAGQANGEGGG